MYGKKRIVLSNKGLVIRCGGKSHHTIGTWYQTDDRFYADLRSDEQAFQRVRICDLAIKAFGGTSTKAELRNIIQRFNHEDAR